MQDQNIGMGDLQQPQWYQHWDVRLTSQFANWVKDVDSEIENSFGKFGFRVVVVLAVIPVAGLDLLGNIASFATNLFGSFLELCFSLADENPIAEYGFTVSRAFESLDSIGQVIGFAVSGIFTLVWDPKKFADVVSAPPVLKLMQEVYTFKEEEAELQISNRSLEADIVGWKERVNILNAEKEGLTSFKQQNVELQNSINTLKSEIGCLEKKINELEAEKLALISQKATLDSDPDSAIAKEYQKLLEEKEGLEIDLALEKEAHDGTKEQLNGRKDRIEDEKRKSEQFKMEMATAQGRLKTACEDIEKAKQETHVVEAKLANAEKKKRQSDTLLKRLQKTHSELEEKFTLLQAQKNKDAVN